MMEISEAAKNFASVIDRECLSVTGNSDECEIIFYRKDAEILIQQVIDEAIAADREQHKIKTSDLAAINAQQEKEIERLREGCNKLREQKYCTMCGGPLDRQSKKGGE